MAPNGSLSRRLRAAYVQVLPVTIFSFFANVLLLVSSIYMLQVFDRVLTSGSVNTLLWLTVIAVIATVAYALLEVARKTLLTRAGSWIEQELATPVLERALASRVVGAKPAASLNDVRDLKGFVGGDQVLVFFDAPWMPIFIAVIWLLDPLLGVIALVSAVTLFLFAVISDLATRRRQLALNRGTRDSNTEAQRVLDQAETAVGLGMTSDLLRRWRLKREAVERDGGRAIDVTTYFQNLSRFVRLSVQVLILGAGAWLVLEGRITAGAMIAASIILARALSPVERSIGAWRSLVQARAAHANLKALFRDDDASAEAIQLPTPSGHLAAHQVRYATGRGHEPILHQVTFDLSPGTACAVIGPSGSGKSTLCRLLVGLWRPTYGTVRLDGADVASWDQQDLARHVGYLPQQVELFAGTVAQNIARMQEADSEAVIRAAQRADVHQLILQLPDGYETDVGLHGAKLSGGQRQRIGLARALFGDPKVLVLDEPNANLDAAGDTALLKTIEEVKREGCTVVLVAHQKAMLRSVDKVLVLKDGGVSAFGDRDDVLYRMAAENRVVSMPEARTRVAGGPPTTSLDEGPAS